MESFNSIDYYHLGIFALISGRWNEDLRQYVDERMRSGKEVFPIRFEDPYTADTFYNIWGCPYIILDNLVKERRNQIRDEPQFSPYEPYGSNDPQFLSIEPQFLPIEPYVPQRKRVRRLGKRSRRLVLAKRRLKKNK